MELVFLALLALTFSNTFVCSLRLRPALVSSRLLTLLYPLNMSDGPAEVEMAGMGVAMEIPEAIATDKVWEVLLIKIKQPDLFLPVSDVLTRPSDDGLGTYREMTAPNKTRVFENIYADESIHEVKFRVADDAAEHVNVIVTKDGCNGGAGVRTLEFYKRLSTSEGEVKVHWAVPGKMALGGIQKVLDMAATL
jgi:hypothetical protein